VDQSFVDELDCNSDDVAIVRAIVGLGESLGLAVVAEGVERPAQADALVSLGCMLAQGYLFGFPEPASALEPFPADDLSSWNHLIRTSA
jgi:EAL domain-containing protein (putative c-di-GMP-specific phosphodiesterase class I)